MSRSDREPPEADNVYLDAVGALLSLHRYLRRSSKTRGESGISGKQHATLRVLEHGALTMRGLSRMLFTGESATSELVSKLQADGYVTRERSGEDNRVVYVTITESGRQIADTTPLAGLPLLRERLRTLDEDDLQLIANAVGKVLEVLEVSVDR